LDAAVLAYHFLTTHIVYPRKTLVRDCIEMRQVLRQAIQQATGEPLT
jgi:hypothetical protein